MTLFIDCATIGHNGNDYAFVLTQLILKVIRNGKESGLYGEISDGSYEVLYEIPVELSQR